MIYILSNLRPVSRLGSCFTPVALSWFLLLTLCFLCHHIWISIWWSSYKNSYLYLLLRSCSVTRNSVSLPPVSTTTSALILRQFFFFFTIVQQLFWLGIHWLPAFNQNVIHFSIEFSTGKDLRKNWQWMKDKTWIEQWSRRGGSKGKSSPAPPSSKETSSVVFGET